MHTEHKIGVIIPVYNEEKFINNTINSIPSFVDRIYVIDDGSTDKVAEVAKSVPDSRVILIQHEINRGLGASISTGYKAALKDQMDIVVKIDGDGQMQMKYMEALIMPIINNEVDYTKGDRISTSEDRRVMPKFRLIGNFILTWQTRVASGYWQLSDSQNGYTAISRWALGKININSIYPYYGACNDIIIQLNANKLKIADVPMPAIYENEKSSIKYRVYIPKVSSLLMRRYLWRLRKKYINLDFLRKTGSSDSDSVAKCLPVESSLVESSKQQKS